MIRYFCLLLFLSLLRVTYCQNNDENDSNIRLIRDFILEISEPEHNFSIGKLNYYFQDYLELEGDLSAYYLSSKFGLPNQEIEKILADIFEKNTDTIPSLAILFLRNKNLHCLLPFNPDNLIIMKYREDTITKQGLSYKTLSYIAFNTGFKDDYLIFEMNPYPDEKCAIIDIKNRKGISVFE